MNMYTSTNQFSGSSFYSEPSKQFQWTIIMKHIDLVFTYQQRAVRVLRALKKNILYWCKCFNPSMPWYLRTRTRKYVLTWLVYIEKVTCSCRRWALRKRMEWDASSSNPDLAAAICLDFFERFIPRYQFCQRVFVYYSFVKDLPFMLWSDFTSRRIYITTHCWGTGYQFLTLTIGRDQPFRQCHSYSFSCWQLQTSTQEIYNNSFFYQKGWMFYYITIWLDNYV